VGATRRRHEQLQENAASSDLVDPELFRPAEELVAHVRRAAA